MPKLRVCLMIKNNLSSFLSLGYELWNYIRRIFPQLLTCKKKKGNWDYGKMWEVSWSSHYWGPRLRFSFLPPPSFFSTLSCCRFLIGRPGGGWGREGWSEPSWLVFFFSWITLVLDFAYSSSWVRILPWMAGREWGVLWNLSKRRGCW